MRSQQYLSGRHLYSTSTIFKLSMPRVVERLGAGRRHHIPARPPPVLPLKDPNSMVIRTTARRLLVSMLNDKLVYSGFLITRPDIQPQSFCVLPDAQANLPGIDRVAEVTVRREASMAFETYENHV